MEREPTKQETEAAEFARALAQDLATDLSDTTEEELQLLGAMARATVACLAKNPNLRGATWAMSNWNSVLEAEAIRRGYQAESEAAELERIFALKTE